MSNNDSITVAPRQRKAPRGQASNSRQHYRQHFSQQRDADTIYDLTALPQPTKTPDVEQQSDKQHYNLSPDALAGYQNHVERHVRSFKCAQLKDSKRDKPSPLAPQHGSRVAKVAHLPNQVPRQPNRSRQLAGSSANNPIAIDDKLTDDHHPGPNNIDDSKWRYNSLKAFDPRESIPPLNADLVKIRPPPPSPSNMHDRGECFLFQVDLARHLALNSVNGPYELGDFLCDIHKENGGFVKIAQRETGPNGEHFWRHLITGERLQPQDGSDVTGKPVTYRNGALFGMQDDHSKIVPPEWTFSEPRNWQPKEPEEPEEHKEHKEHEGPEDEEEADPNHPGLKPDCNPMWP